MPWRLLHMTSAVTMLNIVVAVTARAETSAPAWDSITADPPEVRIRGDWNRSTLLVTGKTRDGRSVDLTDQATYTSDAPTVGAVSESGVVHPRGDGNTFVTVEVEGMRIVVPVHVTGMSDPRRFHFDNDIEPILSRFGCNSSGCHGKAEGQNGFKLSVFGSDPLEDFQSLTREGRGRRLFPGAVQQSVLLTKACGQVPHGGGTRIAADSAEYRTLSTWIAAGTPFGTPNDPNVVDLLVEPAERQLAMRGRQRLRVTAVYADGTKVDVTHMSRFQSNNEIVCSVDSNGLCTAGETPGDAVIMGGYLGFVGVFRGMVPRSGPSVASPAPHNFVDELVDQKLQKLNLSASELATDADYLRRVSLDTIGTLPTADEARRFLADRRADKRARLVEELFERSEFATYWALKWADIFRVDRRSLGHAGAYAYYRWIRESLSANKPYDQFARELVAAEGPLAEAPAGHFFKAVTDPGQMASTLSQSLLGVRIECAQCHHHPFDRWTQADYYGMQAYFTEVGFKPARGGEILFVKAGGETLHPRTGQPVPAHELGEPIPTNRPPGDRRRELAEWMTSPRNPWFAKNLVNRVVAHYLGRGLVEPVDDVRLTNPATNPELLDALAARFQASRYDLRDLIRTITASRTYQLSSRPNDSNERDEQNYSRALFKRIDAEVLSDAISQVTGIRDKFPGTPAGTRAIELWDNEVPHYFLKTFGRPERVTPCTCERSAEPNVAQVLHLLNSPELQAKLAHDAGRLARLSRETASDRTLTEELYLTIYSRYPDTHELDIAVRHLQRHAENRRQAVEDLVWSLLNTSEFLFNH